MATIGRAAAVAEIAPQIEDRGIEEIYIDLSHIDAQLQLVAPDSPNLPYDMHNVVKAVVVLRSDHEGKVSEQDIIDWSRANMAVYKAPTQVAFVQSLPKSGSGKVMWRHLQEAE